jgi:hypothetical protein
VSESQISEINKALKDINHELAVEKVVDDARKTETQEFSTGHAIQSHVRQTVAT